MDTGSSIYEGNVSIIQGTIELTGEKIIINRNNKNANEILDIIIVGNPARYLQDDNTENRVHAVSQHMKYSEKQNQLELLRDARLEQERDDRADLGVGLDDIGRKAFQTPLDGRIDGHTSQPGPENRTGHDDRAFNTAGQCIPSADGKLNDKLGSNSCYSQIKPPQSK